MDPSRGFYRQNDVLFSKLETWADRDDQPRHRKALSRQELAPGAADVEDRALEWKDPFDAKLERQRPNQVRGHIEPRERGEPGRAALKIRGVPAPSRDRRAPGH